MLMASTDEINLRMTSMNFDYCFFFSLVLSHLIISEDGTEPIERARDTNFI